MHGLVAAARPYAAVLGGAAAVATVVAVKGLLDGYQTPGLPRAPNLRGFAPTMTRSEAMEILNLKHPITHGDVERAYLRLARLHHPDRGGSSHIATKINEAHNFLVLGLAA
jgi:DnaJ family protein C protein 19